MSLDSDVIVDRRRIRRKLTFWRVAAAVIAIAAIVGVGVIAAGGRGGLSTSNAIARISSCHVAALAGCIPVIAAMIDSPPAVMKCRLVRSGSTVLSPVAVSDAARLR